jgi:hypothetical protein
MRQFKPGQLQTGSLYNISASFAVTASYLNGYISPFPFTGSARITGSLGVTGSISTTTQFYHPDSLDSSNRTLTDQNTNTSIDWHNRWLIDGDTSRANIKWDDTDTFGITTIPIIENFDQQRILTELQYAFDNNRTIVSGKILAGPEIENGLSDGTLVYYNVLNAQWENFPQSSISYPSNFVTGSLGIVCDDGRAVLLEGTITAIVNSADPTASLGPIIIGTPSIGSPLFAAGSLSNPTTDTVFSTQSVETTDDTVRILGHVIGETEVEGGRGYLIYFNPSNDFYKLTGGKQISAINGRNISAANAIQADSAVTALVASTSSYLNTLNQNLTFNGNLTLNGTASIRTLVVNQTILSTGSNQLGDAANDTQTLYGTVVIPTGSLTITGSVRSTGGFTGSLFGTSSYAIQALSASYAANGGVTQLLAGPNVTLSPTNGLGQVTVSATLSGSTIFNTATGSYGSFYDTTTQTNPVANIPRSMSFNSTDITNGVSISGSTNPFNTYIKTENAGIYNIQFSAQVEKTDSGTDVITIWLRKNGIDLTDSATKLTLSGNGTKVVAAWNWFASSAANDYYQIIWVSADTGMRLYAEPINDTPGIPSVILTVNRVDQFLSNTGSFSGSFTGALTGTASAANTASYVNPLNQNVSITGSLNVSGSTNTDSIYFNATTSSLRLSNDVRNWSLTNKNFSVATQESVPAGIYFKNDGTRFYVIGTNADSIFQYDLSTAWDVTTAVYNSVSLNVSARDSSPIDTFISPDGLILYLAGSTNDAIYRYNLPTAWDLTGATFLNSVSVAAQDTLPSGLYFKPDGTKMYTVGITNDAVYEYNLGTAWDLTTVSFLQSFSLSSFETNASAISFNDAGTRMYVLGQTGDDIIEFRLSTPWDISTSVYFSTSFTFVAETAPGGLYYNETNQVAYVVGTTLDTVYGLSTTPQLTYFGNSFAIDSQMYVGGRFEIYGEAYISGALTTLNTATIGSTLTAPATSISTTSTSIGNSTGTYTINIGGAATSTGITAALASSSIGIGNAGAAGSQKILTIGNGTTGSLNNITIGSGRLLTPTTYLTSSAAEIYSYGSLYNYRTLQVGNNIVGDVELPNGNIVFFDAFTEVSTTELTLHTPNTGSNWQRIFSGSTAATISVRGGLGQSGPTSTIANVGVLYVASASMSTPDYEVKFTMGVQTSSDDNIWLASRILDVNNFYAVKWSTTAANCILYKKVAGVWTALGTAGYSYAGTNIDLSLRVVGNNIFVINAGRLILSTTDSSITGSGFAGYGAGNLGAVSTDDLSNVWEIKNFTVTEYNITNSKSYIEKGNFGIGTTNPSASLHVSGSTRIDNVLTLTPQNPLPTRVPTGSFAVSSSIPPKPFFWDGSAWNALY